MRKKNKKDQRKVRREAVYGTTVGNVTSVSVSIGSDGSVSFETPMTNVHTVVSYDRPTKPKIVSRVPQTGAFSSFETEESLLRYFDFLCAVDTNTRAHRGSTISAVGVVQVRKEAVIGPSNLDSSWRFDVPFALAYDLVSPPIENFGWMRALEFLTTAGKITDQTRVGLIVDSDLGNIPGFNARDTPVYQDEFLPKNVQLIYASADVGKERLLNKTISVADSIAKQVLHTIESEEIDFRETPPDEDRFRGFRFIVPNMKYEEAVPGSW